MLKFLFKRPFSRVVIPCIAVLMLIFALLSSSSTPTKKIYKPFIEPAKSSYTNSIAGIGIIEPKSELISIGTNIPGVVTEIFIKVGDKVKKGDKLFTIDERETKANLIQAEAHLQSAIAERDNSKEQYLKYSRISDARAISAEEKTRREFAFKVAESKVSVAIAQIQSLKTTLERLTVTAPIDGEILNIDIRVGEYAQAGSLPQPLIIMGDTSAYHVRVDIDQSDALNIDASAMALGILRGYNKKKVELIFIHKEPLVRPKNNLKGDSREKVDTRIAQVIYAFDNSALKAQIGQQMEIFIERK